MTKFIVVARRSSDGLVTENEFFTRGVADSYATYLTSRGYDVTIKEVKC